MTKFYKITLLVLGLSLGISGWQPTIDDPDLGWHLLGGQITVEQGFPPSTDNINSFASFWHDYHWFGQILIYSIFASFGYTGVKLFFAFVYGGIFLLLILITERILRQRLKLFFVPTVISILWSAAILQAFVNYRPQIIAALLLAGTLQVLLCKRFSSVIEFLIVFVMAVLAVNIHVTWVFVPMLWFCLRVLPEFLDRDFLTCKQNLCGLILLLLTGFVSPYGTLIRPTGESAWLINYTLLLEYARTPNILKEQISEFASAFNSSTYYGGILFISLAIFAACERIYQWKRDAGLKLLFLITAILSTYSLKFLLVFSVLGFPTIFKASLRIYCQCLRLFPKLRFSSVIPLGFLWCGILYLLIMSYQRYPDSQKIKTELADTPLAACEFLTMHAAADAKLVHAREIRVLTDFNWGGWCRWVSYQTNPSLALRVTSDGRTQWRAISELENSFNLTWMRRDWYRILLKLSPVYLLVDRQTPLASALKYLPVRYNLLYEDSRFLVYQAMANE
ncbi:hypothetical protein JNK13_04290 [bacterium]|nr:hypothetical protein [bacterium]